MNPITLALLLAGAGAFFAGLAAFIRAFKP